MTEQKPIVEILGYIGGQEEDLGGCCQPIIIRINGKEHYILYEIHTYRDSADEDKIKAKHRKVEFSHLEELTSEFDKVKERLGIDLSLHWIETDSNCGYNIPKEEWKKAFARNP